MKTLLLFFLLFFSLILPSSNQGQESTFNKRFESHFSNGLQANSIARTADNNYFFAGSANFDPFVCKMDSLANIIWCRKIVNNSVIQFYPKLAATDNSGVVVAWSVPDTGNTHQIIFCAKINGAGDTVWTKSIDFGNSIELTSIIETNDNSFILLGSFSSVEPTIKTVLIKLGSSGNIIWSKIYSKSPTSHCYSSSVQQTSDNGYIVTGYIQPEGSSKKMFLMKLDQSGSVLWVKRLNTPDPWNSAGFDVALTSNGIFCGVTYLEDYGISLYKTDLMGNPVWTKPLMIAYGNLEDISPLNLRKTSDNGCVFSMTHNFLDFGYIFKFDAAGNSEWMKTTELAISDFTESVDNGYMIIGNGPIGSSKLNFDYYQIGVMKMNSLGYTTDCSYDEFYNYDNNTFTLTNDTVSSVSGGSLVSFPIVIESVTLVSKNKCIDVWGRIQNNEQTKSSLSLFPVPASDKITVESSIITEKTTISVINVNGQEVLRTFVQDKLSEIDISHLPTGIYHLRLWNEKNIQVGKIIKK